MIVIVAYFKFIKSL